MLPRDRTTVIRELRIPAGYQVSLHESIEVPDRYEAHEAQRKLGEFTYKSDAIEACVEDAKKRGWVKGRYDIIGGDDEDAPPKKGCVQCGKTVNIEVSPTLDPLGVQRSPVLWRCNVCDGLVCRDCTLTIPGSAPVEYYHETLCSRACWEKAGRPDE